MSDNPNGTRLFVGNLAWAIDDEELRYAFVPFGEVTDCKVITERETGRSRGFGFVTFASSISAERAMRDMNGSEIRGRSINVSEARPQRPRGNRRQQGQHS